MHWDQTSGAAGTKADVTINGGQTAFSTETGTASITVTPVDDAPVGAPSSASGIEDGGAITGQVQATDVDSTGLTYALVPNSAVGGSVSIDPATGNYSFTPAQDFNGTASFQFTASDGTLSSAAATVSLAISPVNDNPVAQADSGSTTQGVPVVLNVLANDTDVDGDALSVTAVGAASNGAVDIYNGQVRYSPNSGYTGSDAFTYSISDGHGGTATGNVSVNVTAAAPPPAAVSVTFRQGTAGYSGTVDTMLREHYPTDNYGNAFVISPQGDFDQAHAGPARIQQPVRKRPWPDPRRRNDRLGDSDADDHPAVSRRRNDQPDAGLVERLIDMEHHGGRRYGRDRGELIERRRDRRRDCRHPLL